MKSFTFDYSMVDVETAEECIQAFLAADPSRRLKFRLNLEMLRNEIHSLLSSIEENGDAENYDAVYIAIFDGLSWLTEGLRGRAINALYLSRALDCFQQAIRKAGAA